MKKIFTIGLVLFLSLSLSGCASSLDGYDEIAYTLICDNISSFQDSKNINLKEGFVSSDGSEAFLTISTINKDGEETENDYFVSKYGLINIAEDESGFLGWSYNSLKTNSSDLYVKVSNIKTINKNLKKDLSK